MKIQRDKLRRFQKQIQTVLDREHEIAKECLQRGDKNKALLALRKRKYQEQLLKKTDGHLETLEQLVSMRKQKISPFTSCLSYVYLVTELEWLTEMVEVYVDVYGGVFVNTEGCAIRITAGK